MEEETLKQFTTALADAIREMDGTTEPINPQDFAERILALSSDSDPQKDECRIYFDDTDPASKYGATWMELPAGTFLRAAGKNGAIKDYVETDGGSNSVTLTESNLPSMYGYLYENGWIGHGNAGGKFLDNMNSYGSGARGWQQYTNTEFYPVGQTKGGGQAFSNEPLYKNCHIWRKVL